MLCEYGCGQEAKYTLRNKKRCCSRSANSCPVIREGNRNACSQTAFLRRKRLFDSGNFVGKGVSKSFIKKALLENVQNSCFVCRINEWNGKPLKLTIHHVDNDNRNGRVNNLQLLCPNCHSQTLGYSIAKTHRGGRTKRCTITAPDDTIVLSNGGGAHVQVLRHALGGV